MNVYFEVKMFAELQLMVRDLTFFIYVKDSKCFSTKQAVVNDTDQLNMQVNNRKSNSIYSGMFFLIKLGYLRDPAGPIS